MAGSCQRCTSGWQLSKARGQVDTLGMQSPLVAGMKQGVRVQHHARSRHAGLPDGACNR